MIIVYTTKMKWVSSKYEFKSMWLNQHSVKFIVIKFFFFHLIILIVLLVL